MGISRSIAAIILSCIMSGQMIAVCQTLRLGQGHCDFGTIHEKDGKAVRDFAFRNDGPDTLTVCDITTGCRCIIGEPDFRKVAPGETGTVRLIFDPAYRSGPFEYAVSVWYMNRQERQVVMVKGDVVPMAHPIEEDHPYNMGEGLFTSHKVLPLGTIRPGESKSMFFRYGNGTDMPMDLRFEIEGCCSAYIDMERHLILAPDERGKMYVTVTMPEGYSGKHINRIWPVVNGTRLETPILVKMTTGIVKD